MDGLWQNIIEFFSSDRMFAIVRALIIAIAGLVVAKVLSGSAARLAAKRFSTHHQIILRRTIYYVVIALFAISVLYELGFNLSVLVGAAGILSVAIGFASQTSASNIISGLFLLGEQPFGVGDVVQVGSTTGEVIAIDLLSVKLRTFDNLYVRIPNETMLKSEVITLTRFPIRRFDLKLGVAYKEDIDTVRDILFELAQRNPLCLEEPKPLFIFSGFGASSLDIQFSVWAKRENFLDMRNSLQTEIKQAFDARGIEIPFPHVSVYAGSVTAPFPVTVVDRQQTNNTQSG
jgi:small-conductance mechanosensitive channel